MNTFKKRIDELGRIVIPKEIRNSIKINNFDELELLIENDSIIIKKTIGLELYKEKFDNLLKLLNSILNFKILIFNNEKLVSSNIDNVNNFNINSFNIVNNNYNSITLNENIIEGYMYQEQLILDSNKLGHILFINNDKFNDINIIKNIKNIIIDLVN